MSNACEGALRFAACIALAAALCGCAGLKGKLWTYDEKTETDAGSKQDKGIVERSGVSKKADLSGYVTRIGERVAAASDRPSIQWKFTVLDSPDPQAYSTRAGHVYITRGMLALLRSENDLAAVLAHEIAHICTHDAQRTENTGNLVFLGNLAAAVAIQPLSLLLPQVTFAPAGATMAAFSRHNEYDADRRGAEYLRRAGFPSESMSSVMDVLLDLDRYQHDHPKSRRRSGGAIFASHPSTERRHKALGRSGTSTSAAQDSAFLARLEGLEFGSTRHGGIAFGSKRYFAQLDAMIDLPKGSIGRADGDNVWVYFGRGGSMSIERVDPDAAGDLCDILKGIGYGTGLTDIQESSEGGARFCSARLVRPRRGAVSRMGLVAESGGDERYLFRIFDAPTLENERGLLSVARSLESPGPERPKTPVVRIRQMQEGETFASLAKAAHVPDAEAQLRLLNQRYRGGELEAGRLAKVIE
jgi:predicted Zn-dependent protease